MQNQRRHIRFEPDDNTIILVVLDSEPCFSGLCISEAQGGASGVFLTNLKLKVGEMCYIKVGKLDSISSEIVWIKELDNEVVKVGFKYLS
ncbi:MAG: hypothetical protein HON90_10710 [Halobacteriovoraceae bacterium]|jgi:hypothetical protein|nr:hypothetical protein [Halobacteriovoraceae bacterium]